MKTTKLINQTFLAFFAFIGLAGFSQAAITLEAEYHLGETGSMSGLVPQDTSGNGRNFTNVVGSPTIGTVDVSAPGSTHYLDTSVLTNDMLWGANFNTLPMDNFAFGIYARAAENTTATRGYALSLGSDAGHATIMLTANGWAASIAGLEWVGPANGTGFVADTWAHLAFIRSNGVSTFYIDGVAQTGTSTATPSHGGIAHMSTNPGGSAVFDGYLDEARVVSFTSGESTADILSALNFVPVPEPSAALLGGLGALVLLRRRR